MRKLLVTLDDEADTLLAKEKNQTAVILEAVKLYKNNITTDKLEGMRATYVTIVKLLKEIDSKIDYIAARVQ